MVQPEESPRPISEPHCAHFSSRIKLPCEPGLFRTDEFVGRVPHSAAPWQVGWSARFRYCPADAALSICGPNRLNPQKRRRPPREPNRNRLPAAVRRPRLATSPGCRRRLREVRRLNKERRRARLAHKRCHDLRRMYALAPRREPVRQRGLHKTVPRQMGPSRCRLRATGK